MRPVSRFLLSVLHSAVFPLKSGLQNPEKRKRDLYFQLWFVITGIWIPFCNSAWYHWGAIYLDCFNASRFSTYLQYLTSLTLILHLCISSLPLPFPFPHSSQVWGLWIMNGTSKIPGWKLHLGCIWPTERMWAFWHGSLILLLKAEART